MMPLNFTVRVADNFAHPDETEHYTHGTFATADDAIAECRRLVDREFDHLFAQGVPLEKLFEFWLSFGEDPFVAGVQWSSFDYAHQRALALEAPITPPVEAP